MTLLNTIESNRRWAEAHTDRDADFFRELAKGQAPETLWIGCADSRVSPELITGSGPGELFVHRNVANVVAPSDLNLMSVLQYAVDHLKVQHVVICGHEGCGGVAAVVDEGTQGLLDHWLAPVRELKFRHADELAGLADSAARVSRLVALNVQHQVVGLGRVDMVRRAWARDQPLTIHGWVFHLSTGELEDLDWHVSSPDEVRDRATAL